MENSKDKSLLMICTGLAGLLVMFKGYELYKKHQASKKTTSTRKYSDARLEGLDLKPLPIIKTNKIHKIVLTGGPCAGKTTALALISDRLRERGYQVLSAPECASLVFGGGVTINIDKMTLHENIKFHTSLISFIMGQEDRFSEFASIVDMPTVILCDRGAMDVRAYMSEEGWQAMMDENAWNTVELRDKRYDGIIHLVTAADGAEEFYNQNNAARYESQLDQARYIDNKLRESWVGHPKYNIIDNNTKNFQEKMERTYKSVLNLLGIDNPARFYNRYLLEKNDLRDKDGLPIVSEKTAYETFTIEETFLLKGDDKLKMRVRKRGQKGSYFYQVISIMEQPSNKKGDEPIEVKRQISARDYLTLLERKNPLLKPVKKIRQAFVLSGHFCFIDTYTNVGDGLSVLNMRSEVDINSLKLPPSLKIKEDITNNKMYSTYNLAKTEQQSPQEGSICPQFSTQLSEMNQN